ncbi:RNA polymerase sigma factor (fragment) [Candidatus Desulfosporosinus infrequens]|uniref:RNA polymerase sigma factor n=1 Tax=Candidatus Desulfosporosinus infrequens TaxID=2043169 RepID=A0A2U3LRR6_9FIRM
MFGELVVVSIALSVLKGVSLLVSYINNNAFPKPLSGPDEARHLKILSTNATGNCQCT